MNHLYSLLLTYYGVVQYGVLSAFTLQVKYLLDIRNCDLLEKTASNQSDYGGDTSVVDLS